MVFILALVNCVGTKGAVPFFEFHLCVKRSSSEISIRVRRRLEIECASFSWTEASPIVIIPSLDGTLRLQ